MRFLLRSTKGGREKKAGLVLAGFVAAVSLLAAGCDSGATEESSNQSPVAQFTSQASTEGPLTQLFEADRSSDPEGALTSYEWTFGDGESGRGKSVTHTYEFGGTKEVTLEVTDEQGKSDRTTKEVTVDPTKQNYNYDSEYAYQLNVIYFTPADMSPRPGFRRRYSKTLLYIQDWYRRWMDHWGYDDRTFGLLTDDEEEIVKITRIEGKKQHAFYVSGPVPTAGRKIRREIKAYFRENGDATPSSKHYLVITPQYPGKGGPFYALGNWGFVNDKENTGSDPEHGAGGIAHELGHAVNLPHNEHPVSHRERLGEALMSSGNHVWNNPQKGSSKTSLTAVDAAILRQSQVFSREKGTFYGPVNAALTSATGTYENEDIIISGTFESDVPIQKVGVLMNPRGPKGYHQHAFARPVIDSDSFHVRIPISDLSAKKNNDYAVKLLLVPEHGKRVVKKLTEFKFKDGVPNIDFSSGAAAKAFARPSEMIVRKRPPPAQRVRARAANRAAPPGAR